MRHSAETHWITRTRPVIRFMEHPFDALGPDVTFALGFAGVLLLLLLAVMA